MVLESCKGMTAGIKKWDFIIHSQVSQKLWLMLECTRLCWMGLDVSRMVAATAEDGLDLRPLLWKLSAMELSSSGSM